MDEPLSNLDAKLRAETRAQIVKLQRQLGTTTIYVTHDQTEAMTMGSRIAGVVPLWARRATSPEFRQRASTHTSADVCP